MNRKLVSLAVGVVVGIFGPRAVLAQCPDNNPPSGSITYQQKTLTQVEPRIPINSCNTPGNASATFVITAAGSYYLTSGFFGSSGKVGIQINAPDVTIDMQGFSIYGNGVGTYAISTNPVNNVRIQNGHIGNWASGGINASNTTGARAERVSITGCTGLGMRLGLNALVDSCSVDNVSAGTSGVGTGITVGNDSKVLRSNAWSNAGSGIVVGAGSRVVECVVNSNQGSSAIDLGTRGAASGCTLAFNAGIGVNMAAGASVRDCTIEYSLQDGVVCADSCTVTGCTITRSGSPTVLRSGIYVPAVSCSIRDNTIIGAGTTNGYGIAAVARARIERNHCVNHGTGIIVDGTGNFLLSNTCSGNATNFSVVGGNIFSSTSSSTSTTQNVNYSLP